MMRIMIDLQSAQNNSRDRGIGRYVLSLIKALVRVATNDEIFVLVNDQFLKKHNLFDVLSKFVPKENIVSFYSLSNVSGCLDGNEGRRYLAELLREKIIEEIRPDFLIIGSLFEGYRDDTVTSIGRLSLKIPVGVVVYDFIPYKQPDHYLIESKERNWYSEKLKYLERAELLFSISESTRRDTLEIVKVSPSKIVNISCAADFSVEKNISEAVAIVVLKRFGIKNKYLMHVGALDSRKNFEGLIKAYALLPEPLRIDLQLVLVCNANPSQILDFHNFAIDLGLKKNRIVITGYVSDEDLIALYSKCHLFVFPSLQEGFGLPPLEAMTFGVPTIGSNVSSIPEVIGLEAALFDPLSPENISQLIFKCLTDKVFYENLVEHAKQHSKKFSWDVSAEKLLDSINAFVLNKSLRNSSPDIESVAENFLACAAEITHRNNPSESDLVSVAAAVFFNENTVLRLYSTAKYAGQLKWRIDGPFDSSYSLAILNRETARALDRLGHFVILNSPDHVPNKFFLSENPDIALMNSRAADFNSDSVDVLSRNNYPPVVDDMNSSMNMLHHYAWEESGYPTQWVNDFNKNLNGITCLAKHVKKIMIDNGVSVPLITSGCGVDHWERIKSFGKVDVNAKRFRFLHVSSCFPRKGVDSLLDAYGRAFNSSDDVTLIIKTFSNIHNDIHRWLSEISSARNDYPHVVIIESDISEGELKALYEYCHVLVAPSKAEGFGLPMAEAMLTGLPVITTAWGGQLDFCNSDNSWLIDYDFEYSDTHFKLFDSVWAKVKVEELSQALLEAYETDYQKLKQMACKGREFLLENFKWENASSRAVYAARKFHNLSTTINNPNIGWLTTWNTKCGIATYSEHLIKHMPSPQVVFSRETDEPLNFNDNLGIPCWRIGNDHLDGLIKVDTEIKTRNLNTIIIQFNYGLFNFRSLASFINRQVDNGLVVVVTMHATGENIVDYLKHALSRCDRILVHSLRDLNNLKGYGLVDNVALFPHGMITCESPKPYIPDEIPTVSTFGFCLPHKGLIEIIDAVILLKNQGMPIRLRLVTAQYPAPESIALVEHIKEKILDNSIQNLVSFNYDFLSDEASLSLLNESDLIVFAYQNTGESASGAVRYGMATGKPVLVTPLAIFDDLGDAVFILSGCGALDIANGIREYLSDISINSERYLYCSERAKAWRESHEYTKIGERLFNICKALVTEKRLIDIYPN